MRNTPKLKILQRCSLRSGWRGRARAARVGIPEITAWNMQQTLDSLESAARGPVAGL